MRTNLALDDELLTKAQSLSGITDRSALVTEASGVRHFTPIFAPFRKVPPAPARV